MVIRSGKYGSFYACSAFPKCKNTVKIETPSDMPCPLCGSPIVTRRSKKKSVFYGCSSYPSCSFVSWYKPSSTPCPTCGMPLCYKKPEDETPVCCNKECPESK
jgi:DNA topoisomerase-1